MQKLINNMNSPCRLLKNAYKIDFLSMELIPVTKGEIISIICSLKSKNTCGYDGSIICSLKSKKSSGYDGITSKILKMCSMAISESLSYICNVSIVTGAFPDRINTLRTGDILVCIWILKRGGPVTY
jgi:hypothetical protein